MLPPGGFVSPLSSFHITVIGGSSKDFSERGLEWFLQVYECQVAGLSLLSVFLHYFPSDEDRVGGGTLGHEASTTPFGRWRPPSLPRVDHSFADLDRVWDQFDSSVVEAPGSVPSGWRDTLPRYCSFSHPASYPTLYYDSVGELCQPADSNASPFFYACNGPHQTSCHSELHLPSGVVKLFLLFLIPLLVLLLPSSSWYGSLSLLLDFTTRDFLV